MQDFGSENQLLKTPNHLKTCAASLSQSTDVSCLLSTLSPFQRVLKLSSCSNTPLNSWRGGGQVSTAMPRCSWHNQMSLVWRVWPRVITASKSKGEKQIFRMLLLCKHPWRRKKHQSTITCSKRLHFFKEIIYAITEDIQEKHRGKKKSQVKQFCWV